MPRIYTKLKLYSRHLGRRFQLRLIMPSSHKILVVDDDPTLRERILAYKKKGVEFLYIRLEDYKDDKSTESVPIQTERKIKWK